ncbi:MAG TPA: right-handed parallel beta-helix repeat-containing protein [Opitutus sp.]|nr:right-handed parallel beta-helix repeat-containing protein [Opitutus sp.]
MKPILRSLLFLLGLASAAAAANPPRFHVAPPPLGDDAHPGSADAPFATLDRARRAVRAHLETNELHGDLVVELHDGTYVLGEPVRFEPADSGKGGFDVVYRAADNATVVLSGGRRVTGWTREADGAYRAAVGRGIDFRQLWVNGHRATRARTPNAGAMLQLDTEKAADGFDIPAGLLAGVRVQPDEIEFSVLIAWMHKRLRLARLAESDLPGHLRAAIAEPEWDAVTHQPQGDRVYRERNYWLENAREFLDAPGEFFLDRAGGALFYRPRPGEDPATAEIVRPELENLIVLAGRPDAPVQHLRFEGITFTHTGWTRPNRFGFVDVQANSLVPAAPAQAVDPQYRHEQRKDRVPAAFQAATSDRIVVRGCRFARLGGTGVMFTGGGNDNVIEGNVFVDLSAGGIELGEDAARPDDPRLFPRRNRIVNNFIAHIGAEYFGSVAILGYYTDRSLIAHNEITAIPYTGISQGWGWGNPPAPPDSRANRIMHNRISNYMRRLDDGGGIYTTDRQPDSEIAHNVLDGMRTPDRNTRAGGALYPDQFTEGFHIHHNVVSDAIRWLFIWNPNIRDNRVDANYADTLAWRNDGTNNVVEPPHLAANGSWPEAAQAIIAQAGLEPAYASNLIPGSPSDMVIGSDDLEVQLLSGAWEFAAIPGSYSALCRRSVDAAAVARWSLVVPRSARYELKVWRTKDACAARYTIADAGRVTTVTLDPASESGWTSLGEFTLQPGAKIEIRPNAENAARPLIVDALSYRRLRDRP